MAVTPVGFFHSIAISSHRLATDSSVVDGKLK
jgi:hypothetical protein